MFRFCQFCLLICLLVTPLPASAQETTAPYAVLMHADSGRLIFAKNHNEPFPPASMSKIVTAAVVFEKLKAGEIQPQQTFEISEYAWRTGGAPAGGSTMFAELGSRISVMDLLRGLIIQSGNDAAIALAEGISGSVEAFSAEMEAYAERLGLSHSSFANPHGLPAEGHHMSAHDLALVARDIILNHPELYRLFAEEDFTWNGIFQRSRNPLLGEVGGVDGLKTGYTRESGYGLVASAKRGNIRLILVVGGLLDAEERKAEATRLLEWGFANFTARRLAPAGTMVAQARVIDGESLRVSLVLKNDLAPLMRADSNEKVWGRVFYDGPLRAPVEEGTEVGVIEVYAGNEKLAEEPVITGAPVARGSLYQRALAGLAEAFYGILPRVDLRDLAARND